MRIPVALIVSVLLASAFSKASACDTETSFSLIKRNAQYAIEGPLGADQLETQNTFTIRETGERLPFGYANSLWLNLKRMMQPGDEIYLIAFHDTGFYSDEYVLVRAECIVARLLRNIT
jgi:hypothetical protein